MEKVIRDGKVAVLYSPGYGVGWYSANKEHPECLFDPNIVAMVEAGDLDQIEAYCETAHPDLYTAGAEQLEIAWLPVGTRFMIRDYDGDGHETIVRHYDSVWIVA